MKQPQAVSLVLTKKKRKMLKTEAIRSADEEDEEIRYQKDFTSRRKVLIV